MGESTRCTAWPHRAPHLGAGRPAAGAGPPVQLEGVDGCGVRELANLVMPTLGEVIDQAHRGIDRVCRTPHLAYSFLRHTGLSVS
jgi:hypothetical protein